MSILRPAGATHTDVRGTYYKPGDGFGWMRFSHDDRAWVDTGHFAISALSLLPAVEVVDVPWAPSAVHTDAPMPSVAAPIDSQCMDELCVRERLSASKFCILHTVPKAHAAPQLPEPYVAPFTNYFIKYQFVGSRVTCNPPPLDTDQDVLVLVHQSNHAVMERKILEAGFVKEGSLPAEMALDADKNNVFHSYRKGDMNYIVTTDGAFYRRFSTATELARKYNLVEKSDRIQLFQAVLYGKWWA